MTPSAPLEPVTLEGVRVRLEPLRFAHVEALCAVGLDPDIWRWTVAQVRHRDDMRHYVEKALRLMRAGSALPFVTIARAGDAATGAAVAGGAAAPTRDALVGSTRFMNYSPGDRKVEIGGTFVAGPWQRTAINTEAKYLMLRHAFEVLGLQRVEFKTDALNARSRAAIARLGATEEGTLRKHLITESGRTRDSVFFSIVDGEWPAVQARLEGMLRR